MWIKPEVLKMLNNAGLTYKEAGELASKFRKAFESLPTTKELVETIYFNLKHWRTK